MKKLFSGVWQVSEGGTGLFRFGPMQIWVRRQNHDWLTFNRRDSEQNHDFTFTTEGDLPPADTVWNRYAFREEEDQVSLKPAFPDRSLVVRPKTPLQLPPKNEVTFYISIPLWVRLQFGSQNPVVVENLPTVVLSNTWFGLPTEGELCYALKTGAVRELSQATVGEYRAICSLTMKNESAEVFPVTKICLPTRYLSLYQGQTRLWTNSMEIVHQGPNRTGLLRPQSKPPGHEDCPECLLTAAKKPKEDLVHRTFSGFRSLFD